MPRRLVRAAFDRGQIPTVACFNRAKTPLGLDLDKLIAALQKFVDMCVVPVWGTPARLVRSTGFLPGAWALVFLDTADAPGALAYHDLTPDGSADPVEEESFPVDGVAMTDFVYPSYFEGFRKAKSTQFDYAKKVTKPFQLLKGGYQIVFKNGKETQIFGSKAKAKRFGKEDRRGHRSEVRRRRARVRRSRPDRGRLVRTF
jgi:hypothetical protein